MITKPLGTGVLTTGAKADLVSKEDYDAMTCSMATLNAKAAEAAQTFPDVHACTDITGFGLLGHAYEMAEGSDSTLKLFSKKLPLLHGARELAEMGIIPAGAYRNMDYVKPHLRIMDSAEQCLVDLIADPQTSGGLLVALPGDQAMELCKKLTAQGITGAIIGEVVEKTDVDLIIE